MRMPAGTIANAAAWLVIAILIALAILITNRLGFAALFLLGAMTCFVCTRASLDEDAPTWGVHVFKSQMERPRSPEARASAAADRQALSSPLRFYRWCGILLTAIGALGFTWQLWHRS